MNRLVTRD